MWAMHTVITGISPTTKYVGPCDSLLQQSAVFLWANAS
jgi:hypothetical protein